MVRVCVAAGCIMAGALAVAGTASGATIKPTTTADGISNNGDCTLREAIEAANTNASVDKCPAGSATKLDRIKLAGKTYAVSAGPNEDANQAGDLDVTPGGPLAISGKGPTKTKVTSPSGDHALQIVGDLSDLNVSVSKLSMVGASYSEFGGVIDAEDMGNGYLKLDRVQISGGRAQFGGGLYVYRAGLKVTRSSFVGNRAEVTTSGFPAVYARGGAIALTGTSESSISDSTFALNSAVTNDSGAVGGAIDSEGSLTIRRSMFTGNVARSSSVSTSSTRHGGALNVSAGSLHVIDSTFDGNAAADPPVHSAGGAVYSQVGAVYIDSSTFSRNDAAAGAAFANEAGSLRLGSSIVASSGGPPCLLSGGTARTFGFNVTFPAAPSCSFLGPKDVAGNPHLPASASDNGGPTLTLALPKHSAALDLVPTRGCKAAEKTDQRGAERPAGERCDAGAYERTSCEGKVAGKGAIFGTGGSEVLRGTSSDDLFVPSAGTDILKGLAGSDRVCGGSGDDRLSGGGGKDRLDGGPGNDKCEGGPGHDDAVRCESSDSIP